jgi:hypothetical protein
MRYVHLASLVVLADAVPAFAGMPSFSFTDAASMRLQSISFFLLVFLITSLLIRWIWNSLRSDYPRLPRLSYPKALGLVGLWGLLFLLVLTMISGARELMTPGAWKKDGLTYTLEEKKQSVTESGLIEPTEAVRREKLHRLFAALVAFAFQHEGHYPQASDPVIPADLWETPHASGMRYIYQTSHTTKDRDRILACEPELFDDGRLVLLTSGEVKRMSSADIALLLSWGNKP